MIDALAVSGILHTFVLTGVLMVAGGASIIGRSRAGLVITVALIGSIGF